MTARHRHAKGGRAPHATIVLPHRRAPRYDSIHMFEEFVIFGSGLLRASLFLGFWAAGIGFGTSTERTRTR